MTRTEEKTVHMSEQMYRELVASRFGDDVTITYEPVEDDAGARTGTRVLLDIPRDARETFRQAQFMRVAEMTGGHDWELERSGDRLRLVIETQYRLPSGFSDASDSGGAENPHTAYVDSLTRQFAGD